MHILPYITFKSKRIILINVLWEIVEIYKFFFILLYNIFVFHKFRSYSPILFVLFLFSKSSHIYNQTIPVDSEDILKYTFRLKTTKKTLSIPYLTLHSLSLFRHGLLSPTVLRFGETILPLRIRAPESHVHHPLLLFGCLRGLSTV